MDPTTPDPTNRETTGPAGRDRWLPQWDGSRYAANTGHHRRHDDWFLEHFPVLPTDRVLDLGCGSGDFTRVLAELVPQGEVVGLDAQPSMVEEARSVAAANQSFVVAPVQDLDRVLPAPAHDETFDVVSSRSVLHWVPAVDHAPVLRAAHRLLRPGGFLRIECGGAGNVGGIVAAFDAIAAAFDGPAQPWTFFDAGAYLELLERCGFLLEDDGYVRTVAQRRPFTRETFRGWVHSQAIEAYLSGIRPEHHAAFVAAVDERLDDFRRHDGTFDQTFVRLDLLVRKRRLVLDR